MDMDMDMDMDMELVVMAMVMDMDMVMEDMVDIIMGKDLQRSFLNKLSTKDPLMLDMAMVMAIAKDMDMVIIDSWSDLHNMLIFNNHQ